MFDGDECDWLDFVFHGSVPFFCEVGVWIVGDKVCNVRWSVCFI